VPILLSSLLYTACTQDVVEESSPEFGVAPKIEDLGDLKDFKTGQVDFFKGLTEDEIALYEKYKHNEIWDFKANSFTQTDEGKRFLKVIFKISFNGTSYAIDKSNQNQLTMINEYVNKDNVRYSDASKIRELDIEKSLLMFNNVYLMINGNEEERKQAYESNQELLESENLIIEQKSEVEEITDNIDVGREIITEQRSNTDPIPFSVIGHVSHFNICTGTQTEIKKCTTDEITNFINQNFDTGKFKHLTGRNKINVQFKINKDGRVVDINAAAKTPELKAEAKRVISMIPQMQAGMSNGEPVDVIYALPIIFQVQD
jgi:hypothetical protein